jgi:hypothetical protein
MPETETQSKYVIYIPLLGWVRPEKRGVSICDNPYDAHPFTSQDMELAQQLAGSLRQAPHMKGAIVLPFEEAVSVYANKKTAERCDPNAVTEAEDEAQCGQGYTAEEWGQMPDSYLGMCEKECYGPGMMQKGDVWEYGVRGVYVCSGCGYAYPPLLWPNPHGSGRSRRADKMSRISEGPSRRYDVWQGQHRIRLGAGEDLAFPPAFNPLDDIDALALTINDVRSLVSQCIDSPVLSLEVVNVNGIPYGLSLSIVRSMKEHFESGKHLSIRHANKLKATVEKRLGSANTGLHRRVFISIEFFMPPGLHENTVFPAPEEQRSR